MEELPSYNDAKELERRAKLVEQSPLSVDKPGAKLNTKGMRFRVMKPKPVKKRRRFNPKRPEFL